MRDPRSIFAGAIVGLVIGAGAEGHRIEDAIKKHPSYDSSNHEWQMFESTTGLKYAWPYGLAGGLLGLGYELRRRRE
jgi:hypothetical protein